VAWAVARTKQGRASEAQARYTELAADAAKFNPLDETFENKRINLDEFVHPVWKMNVGKVFRRCEILGTRPIILNGITDLSSCNLQDCDFVVVKTGHPIRNAIGFQNTRFIDCSIYRVTIYIPKNVYEQMRPNVEPYIISDL
jgi:hypothetical protein